MTRFGLIALSASCVVALAACASRPSEQELADAILAASNADPSVDVTTEEASCIAAQLLASDLSDTTLSGLAEDFRSPEMLETEIDDVVPEIEAAAVVCR